MVARNSLRCVSKTKGWLIHGRFHKGDRCHCTGAYFIGDRRYCRTHYRIEVEKIAADNGLIDVVPPKEIDHEGYTYRRVDEQDGQE